MGNLFPNITAAFRALQSRPTLTIAAILTLALSIGATTAIFTVVNGVVLRPLPFANESRLVSICEVYPGSTPDELAAFLSAEMDKWGAVIRESGIKVQ